MTAWKITYRNAAVTFGTNPTQDVDAEYFKLEDGWFTFKTEDHKAVYTANAEDVVSVARTEKPAN